MSEYCNAVFFDESRPVGLRVSPLDHFISSKQDYKTKQLATTEPADSDQARVVATQTDGKERRTDKRKDGNPNPMQVQNLKFETCPKQTTTTNCRLISLVSSCTRRRSILITPW